MCERLILRIYIVDILIISSCYSLIIIYTNAYIVYYTIQPYYDY